MGAPIEGLQRIGLKVFASDDSSVRAREVVPVFHRWIQTRALDGLLLVDVADYAHVPEGPGAVLIAHEGNFSIDLAEQRLGLLFYRKTAAAGSLGERLRQLARTTLHAARLLEQEAALAGRLRFRGEALELFANDRLLAPNDATTRAAFAPALRELLATLYGPVECRVDTTANDVRDRFGLHITAPQPVSVTDLLTRLA
ncbi:MAG: hypothetical protein ACRERC_05730 [Candidatus Binatia bacterium]